MSERIDWNKPTEMVWYNKPIVGYEVIAYARQGLVWGIRNPFAVIIPELDKQWALNEAMTIIQQNWSRVQTIVDVRIYAFGGLIRTFKVVQRQRRWNEVDAGSSATILLYGWARCFAASYVILRGVRRRNTEKSVVNMCSIRVGRRVASTYSFSCPGRRSSMNSRSSSSLVTFT